jgi:hypothetical protein
LTQITNDSLLINLCCTKLDHSTGNEERFVKKIASLTITLALGCAGAVMAQQQAQALNQQQISAQLTQQGYTDIHDLSFDDGVWSARARSGNGERVKLRVDPITGQAYPNKQVSSMSEADIRSSLSVQGYTDVRDVDFDHGIWTVKAKSPAGAKVSLKVDAESGRVIGVN